MKKFYFLFLLLSFSFANGMEEPERPEQKIVSNFQTFNIECNNRNFPEIYDDKIVATLNGLVHEILDVTMRNNLQNSNNFKQIMGYCLLGHRGLMNHNTYQKMNDDNKNNILETIYFSICANDQLGQNLLDFFLFSKETFSNNDDSNTFLNYNKIYSLAFEDKYKTIFTYFKDKISEAILCKDKWTELYTIIDDYHNHLLQFVSQINNKSVETFYQGAIIRFYVTASNRLKALDLSNEALNILEKVKAFSYSSDCEKLKNYIQNKIVSMYIVEEVIDQGTINK